MTYQVVRRSTHAGGDDPPLAVAVFQHRPEALATLRVWAASIHVREGRERVVVLAAVR